MGATPSVARAWRCAVACLACAAVGLPGALEPSARVAAQEAANDDLVPLVIGLVQEQDKDLRALGLEQVRTSAKGADATRQFAALLPKLSADAQVGLLSALAERGDVTARPDVAALVAASQDEGVRASALAALAVLGDARDVPAMLALLASESASDRQAARDGLPRLRGDTVSAEIAAALATIDHALRVTLIEILAERRAFEVLDTILALVTDDDAAVRAASMNALGQLAGPDRIPGMVRGLLKASGGTERADAEKAIMFVCARTEAPDERAAALLAEFERQGEADRRALLPCLGRVGGARTLAIIEGYVTQPAEAAHDVGIRALCNWPEAAIAPRLIELVESDAHDEHRLLVLRALIRVAPLPDQRSPQERLDLLKQVLTFCTRDEDRNRLLGRAHAVRSVETLRFLLPFLDQPTLAQQACESIVELAHHRELRDANKPEFHAALDRVLAVSQDSVVTERATRYKNGQTWVRPKPAKR